MSDVLNSIIVKTNPKTIVSYVLFCTCGMVYSSSFQTNKLLKAGTRVVYTEMEKGPFQ